MIQDILDNLIKESMKAHNTLRVETYRAIKAAFLNWKTARENVGKEMTESDEINVLKKMVKQRQDSVDQYLAAKREDLAKAENDQISVIKEFLPEEVTAEQIEATFSLLAIAPVKQNMGLIIKEIKRILPNADGKLVADIVKSKLN